MFKNILKLKNNKKGVTLLEMTVSIALFAFIMLSAMQIFKMVVEGQRRAISSQNIQESMRYAFEIMSKEIRMAQKDGGVCDDVADDMVYRVSVDGDILYFKNYHGECVTYQLADTRLEIIRGSDSGYITSKKIEVSDLKFSIQGDPSTGQPIATMKMKIKAVGKEMHSQEMIMQTSVSARYYE